jgi:hypothetical protein
MTNGGLVYHQHYANAGLSHVQPRPGSDYVDGGRLLATAHNTNLVKPALRFFVEV